MKFFRKFIKKDISLPLGRWNLNDCDKQMARKIDLANEDHCGPCGEYAIIKKELQQNKQNLEKPT